MTRTEIAEARARCEAATKGKWVMRRPNGRPSVWLDLGANRYVKVASVEAPDVVNAFATAKLCANADFIADAHQTLPKALDALEAALDRIEKLEWR